MADKVDVYAVVTDRIIEQLEAGTVPWRKPWNASNGPRNLKGNLYRGINVFLLGMSPYQSPFWLTFKQAREAGGTVRKGETSTLIVFWKRLKVTDKDSGELKVIPMLRYYRVFNLEQTENVKLPKRVAEYEAQTTHDHNPDESAEAIIAGYANGPSITERGSVACYSPELDTITVPPRSSYAELAEHYSTVFHEIGHSTGHKSRLDRFKGNRAFGSHDYGREELIAEMTAAFLCAEAGVTVPESEANSAAYLQSWIRTIREDVKAVVTAAGAAQRAADHVLGRTFADDKTDDKQLASTAA
jgi:antirestriction protein ArdC